MGGRAFPPPDLDRRAASAFEFETPLLGPESRFGVERRQMELKGAEGED
jgi:hypothetical protein